MTMLLLSVSYYNQHFLVSILTPVTLNALRVTGTGHSAFYSQHFTLTKLQIGESAFCPRPELLRRIAVVAAHDDFLSPHNGFILIIDNRR